MHEVLHTMETITQTPAFGVGISLLAYAFGIWLNRKWNSPLVNPLLIAVVLIVPLLLVFDIPYANYQNGGVFLEMFLTPATAAMAVKVYEQLPLLKKNWLPVVAGATVGALASVVCIWVMCRWFGLDEVLTVSLLPKSVTTAIAVPMSELRGGVGAITVVCVAITGVLGAVCSPLLIRLFQIKDPIAAGTAIGTSSHALGTSKAIQIGDTEGAMSSCALGIAGLATVLFLMFF